MRASTVPSNACIKSSYHTAIYHWARQYVEGTDVLDAGCGEGFGAAILAESARHVTGVDIDPDAIANIDVRYRLPNTTYQPMDCQAMTFGDASFDVIVSNALLEYLTDCDAFFDEVMRVLRPGGTFICGTKNADLSIKARDGSPLYPDHLREFSPEQLRSAIATRLAEVQVFSQVMASKSEAFIMDPRALFIERWLVRLNAKHIIPIQWRNSVRRWITGIDRYAIGPDDFEITAQDQFHDAFYLVAVSKRA